MSHVNIVTLFDAIETTRQLFLVMEHVQGSTLNFVVRSRERRRLGKEEAEDIFVQLMKAMEYLDQKHISHRDIKLENIIVEKGSKLVKLIDFGFACQSREKLRIFCGTPSYMSPEIVSKKDYFGNLSDIWACGILLYYLVCGYFPFKSSFEKELYKKIQKC